MREIKFRYRFRNRKTGREITDILTICEIECGPFEPPVFKDWQTWEVLSRDRSTGLLDKNGKEIYEGDRLDLVPQGYARVAAYVVWDDKRAQFRLKSKLIDSLATPVQFPDIAHETEVIGSVYENRDMLESSS